MPKQGRILDYLMRLKAGKRTTDIALPNESGRRDPRLPSTEEDQINQLSARNQILARLGGK